VGQKPDNLVWDARHGQQELSCPLELWSLLCHIRITVNVTAARRVSDQEKGT